MVLVCVLKLDFRFWKGKATKEVSNHRGDEKTSGFSRHSFHEPCPRAFKNSADGSSFLSCCLQSLPRSLSFQGRVKAGFFHLGSTFRAGQSAAGVSEPWAAGHCLAATAAPAQHSCPSSQCSTREAVGWGGGNDALDPLPLTALIYSWLLLNQFLAVVHGADIALLLLPSKRSWKKCLLSVFSLYVQKLYPKQEQLSPDNVTG